MKERTCKNCPKPTVSRYHRYCVDCKPIMAEIAAQNTKERDRIKQLKRRAAKKARPKLHSEPVPSSTAIRLATDTAADIREQAHQELRHLVRCFADAPAEGSAAQAAYRRMMGRMGAIGGIA